MVRARMAIPVIGFRGSEDRLNTSVHSDASDPEVGSERSRRSDAASYCRIRARSVRRPTSYPKDRRDCWFDARRALMIHASRGMLRDL